MNSKIKNILLLGSNSRNKGHEAMTVAAVQQFSRLYPGCCIKASSYMKKEPWDYGERTIKADSACEKPVKFEVIGNRKIPLRIIKVLLCCVLPLKSLNHRITNSNPYLKSLLETDIIIEESGNAMSDMRPLWRRILYCIEILISRCLRKPHVIFTQSMGPFNKLSTRILGKLFLPMADMIIIRGKQTYNQLDVMGTVGKVPVHICFDSAILFRPKPLPDEIRVAKKILHSALANDEHLIAIAPSIRLFENTSPKNSSNSYIQWLVHLCNFIQAKLMARIVFICHEPYQDRYDDGWLIEQVTSQMKVAREAIKIPGDYPAGVIKAAIGQLDFLVSSRFHVLIAALASNTPFVSIGWTHKFDELVEEIGIPDNNISFRGLTAEYLIQRVESAWNRRNETRKRIAKEYDRLYQSAERAFHIVDKKYAHLN